MSESMPPVVKAPDASSSHVAKNIRTSDVQPAAQSDEQPAVATAIAGPASRADRKCGKKSNNDAAWGSATDCGNKFIACIRQDDELLDFFTEQRQKGDTLHFSSLLHASDLDNAKMEDIFAFLKDSDDWASTFRALDSIRVVSMLKPELLAGHEVEVCSALLPLVVHLRSALQRNSLLAVSTLFSKAVAIAPRDCNPALPFAELLQRIVRIAAAHDKSFMRKVAKSVLKVVIKNTPSEGVARAVAHPNNLRHKNMAVAFESAACLFGCAKSASKLQSKDTSTVSANLLSTWTFDSQDMGLGHILALIFKSKFPKVKKMGLKVASCLREHYSQAADVIKAALVGEGEWCLSKSEADELFCTQQKKRKARRPLRNVANMRKKARAGVKSKLAKPFGDCKTSTDATTDSSTSILVPAIPAAGETLSK